MRAFCVVWFITSDRGVFLQENGSVCDDCVKFIADTQAEAKKNSSFVNSLIEQIESQCELLGPGISDIVSTFNLILVQI